LDAKTSVAELEAGRANESAAKLEKESEVLRGQNLELEKAISPRVLEEQTTAQALSSFPGVQFVVISPSDFEPKRTAGQIRFMLDQAKWIRYTAPLFLGYQIAFFDGVRVHVLGVSSNSGDLTNKAARALVSVLNENEIVAVEGAPLLRLDEHGAIVLPITNGSLVIVVEVGPKPLPQSLKMGPPKASGLWGNFAE
jgi:hypothetical protein